jgi:integrase/recombinase XerD
VDGVPGFVPRLLRDPGVTLFRADDRVFEAMVDGWRTQMLARGLAVDTIKTRTRVVERFQLFTGDYPWTWRPVDIEDYLGELRSRDRPIGLTTLRSYSNAVSMFCAYLTHPGYGWGELCERTFGDVPAQICFDWNTPRHTTDDAAPPARRAFTRAELQQLFDYIDDVVDREYAAGSKRWLPALRDSTAFKVCYAYGLRRREITMLDLEDFGPNPHLPDYGRFGATTVRWGKGTAPRRRTVLTVPEFSWVVDLLEFWITAAGRGRFPTAERSSALWPSERSHRVSLGALSDSFADYQRAAGLPDELGLHCLRHSYVTHLIEAGYDPAFVQTQVGHAYASTTGLYTSVSADFKQRSVRRMIAARLGQLEGPAHD